MAIPKITGSGPNSRTNLKNIHSGERSFQKDLSTTHSQISLMQQALTSLGYDTKGTDGIFGDNTASAVNSFQRACNLTADGYFGKNSLLNLEKLLGHHLDPDADGCGATGSSGSGDSSSGGSSDSTIQVGDTVITSLPAVNFRKTPGGSRLTQVAKGTTMKVTGIENSGGYKWYEGVISNEIGYLREDCVKKYVGSTNDETIGSGTNYTVDNFGHTNKEAVFVRKTANGEKYSTTKKLLKGSTFLIKGTETVNSTVWVKILYGTGSGSSTHAYISGEFFDEISTKPPKTAKERCIQIAESLVGVHEDVLGLKGDCCQQFIYWLCGACGIAVTQMPYGKDTCGPARNYFKSNGTWHPITDNYLPHSGDLVYYGETDADISNHVGLVVSGGNNYESVECNLSDIVKLCTGDVSKETCSNGKHIQGFATPTWS